MLAPKLDEGDLKTIRESVIKKNGQISALCWKGGGGDKLIKLVVPNAIFTIIKKFKNQNKVAKIRGEGGASTISVHTIPKFYLFFLMTASLTWSEIHADY